MRREPLVPGTRPRQDSIGGFPSLPRHHLRPIRCGVDFNTAILAPGVPGGGRKLAGAVAMRIAQIAPLYEAVPPKFYGGTERAVSFLTEELVALGHEVTLFASGGSVAGAELEAVWPQGLRLDSSIRDQLAPHMLLMETVRRQTGARGSRKPRGASRIAAPERPTAARSPGTRCHGQLPAAPTVWLIDAVRCRSAAQSIILSVQPSAVGFVGACTQSTAPGDYRIGATRRFCWLRSSSNQIAHTIELVQ